MPRPAPRPVRAVGRRIEALWEHDPPKTARTIVQFKAPQLRKLLGGRIWTSS
ncbi:hypothetical protein [Nonomuraea sp. NPDC005650]|uniref:hypothetical protein n=1 Tax=Nonomuraea sp. NPDC005650 TaxID=3157045 RepID=UPI00339F75A1